MLVFEPIYTCTVASDVRSCPSFPPAIHYTSSIPSLSSVGRESSLPEPFFSSVVEASEILYNLLAPSVTDVLPQPVFLTESTRCFRPSAMVLTSFEMLPDAMAARIVFGQPSHRAT